MNTKIDFKKILGQAKTGFASTRKLFWTIGLHAFSAVLILILLDVLFGGFIFYKYIFLAKNQKPEINTASFQFEDDPYQKVLNQWQERDTKLAEYLQKNYPSPF